MAITLEMSVAEMRKIVILAIKQKCLNALFSETLSDLPQHQLVIHSEDDLQPYNLAKRISNGDIIITNDHYAKMQADFQVIDSSGEVILTISPNGQSINNINQDEYLNDDDELNKLLRLYKQICDSDAVIIPALE